MPIYNHIPKVEPDMEGATADSNGKAGLVPAPEKGDANRALMADGTWRVPQNATKLNNCPVFNPSEKVDAAIPVIQTVEGIRITDIGTVLRLCNANGEVVGFLSFQNEYDSRKPGRKAITLFPTGGNTDVVAGDLNSPMVAPGGAEIGCNATIENNCDVGGNCTVGKDITSNGNVFKNAIIRSNTADAGPYFAPITTENTRLGHGNAKWSAVYATSPEIVTSDKNLKDDIAPFSKEYEELFFDLQPSIFKFKDGESNRTHSGFISQDVEEALKRNGLSALDFAAFCKDQKTEIVVDEEGKEAEKVIEGEYIYSLRYQEFIALNTHMLQKLYAKVNEMQEEINRLKGEM